MKPVKKTRIRLHFLNAMMTSYLQLILEIRKVFWRRVGDLGYANGLPHL